ncbi:MAG: glycoside hydrolase family 65 protein, partial [Caldiserica bacterium]
YIKRCVFSGLKREIHKNFDKLLEESFKIWQKRWEIADIKIRGDRDIERGLRFNIYHLINSAPRKEIDASIPARGVSGEGYRGHIFWDTEIFIFPFFVYLFPDIAKNLLLYRVKRLEKAREIAKANGYEGAMFPWESAHTGDETTPSWSKDFDGRIIRIITHKQEHHITGDIGYALIFYFRMTQDYDFMLKYGLEMLFEIARFWNSRLEYNRRRKFYEIRKVMGPDEFHPDVNNNTYTNFLAKYILEEAVKTYKFFSFKFGKRFKKVIKRISLKKNEVMEWEKKAESIFIPCKRGIIESFEGYLKLKKYPLPHLNKHFLPEFPSVPLSKIHRTQFIKQPDVVMLFALFPDRFSFEEKKRNFLFYEKRTLHKSSLSPSVHSLVAAQLGMETFAYRYLKLSTNVDLQDVYGNTSEGIHMANAGSCWQTFVRGIGGVREEEGTLLIQPHLPKHWKEISFKSFFKGILIEFFINHEKVKLKVLSSLSEPFYVIVYGKKIKIGVKREYVFSRKEGK